MQEYKIYFQLGKYLTILNGQIKIRTLNEKDIIQAVNKVDQSIETIKNHYIGDSNRLLIDEWMYLVKALKHFFEIRKSVDPKIEKKPDLDKWLICEILKINNYLNELKNGTI